MNGHTESRERHAPQPATAIASHRVRPDKVAEYLEAQTAITDAARRFDGFVGTEVLGPVAGLQEEWVAIFRLESNQAMKRWLASPERLQLAARIDNFLIEPSRLLVLASDDNSEPPVAMVFAHRIVPGKVADYLAWRRRAIAAQAHHPGYLATEFFEPHGKLRDEWIDIVRYDSVANLTNWMESKERQDLLKELESIVESMHAHRLTGLEGWFGLNRGSGAAASGPPSWKQALAVLFALYPTVMAADLSKSADAESVAAGSDVYQQSSFGHIADLAGDAQGDSISQFLARCCHRRLEKRSTGARHGSARSRDCSWAYFGCCDSESIRTSRFHALPHWLWLLSKMRRKIRSGVSDESWKRMPVAFVSALANAGAIG